MNLNDMIMISVDDHVVEPPHLFDGRMPAKFADLVPKVITTPEGDDVWTYNGAVIPNIGLNAVAGRPREEYGIEPTAIPSCPRRSFGRTTTGTSTSGAVRTPIGTSR